VLSLFDPYRYKVSDPGGYDLNKLKSEDGAKFFRSLRLIKNSDGNDELRVGLGFLGELGIFSELPRLKEMTDDIYESVINKSFFLNK